MATMDEYKAVHAGNEPPGGLDHSTELGHGGCNVISKDSGGVVGRWGSWETASVALNRLQKLGGRYEYRLEESHQWVPGPEHSTICAVCSVHREVPASSGTALGIDWP
ncbi:hypothetical protein NicSoilC5_39010 [Arthrobacter sp. NicSoilC5]|nr:hypothetical protein NicSoilC5_39010 [Arthrobacter sp. NicSoilC5]